MLVIRGKETGGTGRGEGRTGHRRAADKVRELNKHLSKTEYHRVQRDSRPQCITQDVMNVMLGHWHSLDEVDSASPQLRLAEYDIG